MVSRDDETTSIIQHFVEPITIVSCDTGRERQGAPRQTPRIYDEDHASRKPAVKAMSNRAALPCITHFALWRKRKRGVNGRARDGERVFVLHTDSLDNILKLVY